MGQKCPVTSPGVVGLLGSIVEGCVNGKNYRGRLRLEYYMAKDHGCYEETRRKTSDEDQ